MTKISVIGSGVIGSTIAFDLALKGFKIKVITKDIYEAASWVAGGMLAPFSEGLEGEIFNFSYESLKLYKEYANKIEEVSKQKIDLWMEGINRIVFQGESELIRKAQLYSKVYKVEIYEEAKKIIPQVSEKVEAIIHYQEEGWVDAQSLMNALKKALGRLNVDIIQDSIVKVIVKNEQVEKLIGIKGEYTSDIYIFCLGAWTRLLWDIPINPVKGQAITVGNKLSKRVLYSNVSYIIPRNFYTYIGATSEHGEFSKTATVNGVFSLMRGLLDVLPNAKEVEFLGTMVGFRPCTPDNMPVFQIGENYIVASGHCRNGILQAPITAKIVKDYIESNIKSKYFDIFSNERMKA